MSSVRVMSTKMQRQHIRNSVFVVMAMLFASCQGMEWKGAQMPTMTRTGVIWEIDIRDTLSPSIVTANPGDEIRWINKRQGGARVVFLDPIEGQLSCQRGFGGWRGANPNQFAAEIEVNQSASVCLKNTLKAKYVIEADSTLIRSEQSMQGSITIETLVETTTGILIPREPTLPTN